jgi:hypothetical protein
MEHLGTPPAGCVALAPLSAFRLRSVALSRIRRTPENKEIFRSSVETSF